MKISAGNHLTYNEGRKHCDEYRTVDASIPLRTLISRFKVADRIVDCDDDE